jgi:hypothetical protein
MVHAAESVRNALKIPANGAFKKSYLSIRGKLSWKIIPQFEDSPIKRVTDVQRRARMSSLSQLISSNEWHQWLTNVACFELNTVGFGWLLRA